MPHSKGNWKASDNGHHVVTDSPIAIGGWTREEDEFYGGYLIAESIATKDDAHLIAAAPELLESLIWLMARVSELHGDVSMFGMSKCYEAIAKAKGEDGG